MENIAELQASIATDIEHATEIMGEIAHLMAAGRFDAASVRSDYLLGRIKSAERTQKRIAKLEKQKAS